jgi:signal transduction histidine kinase
MEPNPARPPGGVAVPVFDATRRLASRSATVVDVALATALGLAAIAAVRPWDGGLIATLGLVIAPVALRRRAPEVLLAMVGGATVATDGIGGALDIGAFAILAYSAGERPARPTPSLFSVVAITLVLSATLLVKGAETWAVLAPVFIGIPAWLVGDFVRGQAISAAAARANAAQRDRQREASVRESVAAERRAMARELHDVVAHSVSVMVVQAGAAREVAGERPELVGESLANIESAGRSAMTELRRLVGVLADDEDSEAPRLPAPGLARLDDLVRRVREAGLPIDVRTAGRVRALPDGADIAAYRVVQEALTNVLRHAPGAPTHLTVEWRDDEVKVEILDDGVVRARPATEESPEGATGGRGLIGLRERVELVGGRFEAGPRFGGGFAVRAWLPAEPVVPGDGAG